MKLRLRNARGGEVGHVDVREDVFGVSMNESLVHQVMVGQLANARQGTVRTKTRAEVSGGGAKPHPQKGTGRARAGSTRAPNWKGGGVVFGPNRRSYRHHTPKGMRRRSLVALLSDKVRENQLIVLDSLELDEVKTREMIKVLEAVDAKPPVLLVADGADPSVLLAARNIPRLKMLPSALLNTVDLLNHPKVVITLDGVRKVEELWGGRRRRATSREVSAAS